MIATSVMAALDQAGVPRHDADGRTLLQAARITARGPRRVRQRASSPSTARRGRRLLEAPEVPDPRGIATTAEWGPADTGARP